MSEYYESDYDYVVEQLEEAHADYEVYEDEDGFELEPDCCGEYYYYFDADGNSVDADSD